MFPIPCKAVAALVLLVLPPFAAAEPDTVGETVRRGVTGACDDDDDVALSDGR